MKIPFCKTNYGELERVAVLKALESGNLQGDGAFSKQAEELLARKTGVPHASLVPSGTHALELALQAIDIGPGDEVICPSFTFVSTANAVIQQGARPVFCEITEDTLNLDPDDLSRRITGKTRAVVPVHYAGVACDMDRIGEVVAGKKIHIIEDAAHALGSSYKGRAAGNLGHAGAFSFHDTKNTTCGEGGAVTTADPQIQRRMEIIREKGTNRTSFLRGEVDKYTWVAKGSSYLMSDLLSALLVAQLKRMDEVHGKREKICKRYEEFLVPYRDSGRISLGVVPEGCVTNYHLFWLLAKDEADRDHILQGLRKKDIGATFHFVPLDSSPYARQYLGVTEPLPVTRNISDRLVRLPLYPDMSEEEQTYVLDELKKLL